MSTKYLLPVLILLFTLNSCKKSDDLAIDSDNLLVGHWVLTAFGDENTTFQRADSLPENDYGLSIKSDGTLVERKNAGWCGTPPIMYADYAGNWSQRDSNLVIKVDFWGGLAQLTWEIERVNATTLIVKRIAELYPVD